MRELRLEEEHTQFNFDRDASTWALELPSWIHPGKSAWGWWNGTAGADGKAANTTAGMEYFVDFAAQSGFSPAC